MRILITTIQHYEDSPSGSSGIAHHEACWLAEQGHEVWVLGAKVNEASPEYEVREGRHLLRYSYRKYPRWNPRRALAHQDGALAVLRKYLSGVDAVHGHIPLTTLAAQKLYGRTARTGYTIHSPMGMEMSEVWSGRRGLGKLLTVAEIGVLNHLERRVLDGSETITALSQYTKRCITAIHGERIGRRIEVVPGYADTARFRPAADRGSLKRGLGWPEDVPVLFTLRRLTPRMGLDRLIEAAGMLLKQGARFRLVIGGQGPLRSELEKQVRAVGVEEQVEFAGFVSEDALPRMYAACDAFVLPTAALECFGLIALEALASGRPVLATPVAAIPEMIRLFEPRWLAESNEASSIAALLGEFLAGRLPMHDPAELHNKVEEEFSSAMRVPQFGAVALGKQFAANRVEAEKN